MTDILIVEDNPVNQKLIAILLARAGYTYEVADNGKTALDKLAQEPFRLVLMDMMMPIMNGYDATKAIRQDPRLQHIPVIALTANVMRGEDERCRAAGCDEYLSKPYSKSQILSVIDHQLKRAVRRTATSAPPGVPG